MRALPASALLLLVSAAGAAEIRPVQLKLPPAGASMASGVGAFQAPKLPLLSAALRLPIPALAVPQALKTAAASARPEGPKGQTLLGALGRFEGKVAASMRGGDTPDFGGAFDGEEERARSQPRKAEEKKQARAERPVLDFLRGRFNEDEARELARAEYEFSGGRRMTGKQVLALITTARAASPDAPPDLSRVDPALLGVSDTELHALAEREGVPAYALQNFYELAFRRGLIYRLDDSARGRTYYGMPDFVRAFLGLEAPRAPEELAREKARGSAFVRSLPALAEAAQSLPEGEELFEFAAQALEAAVKDKLLERESLPAAFRARAEALDLEAAPLKDALLTLLESSEGTPWFERALAACEGAAADGLLPRAELDEVLRSLR